MKGTLRHLGLLLTLLPVILMAGMVEAQPEPVGNSQAESSEGQLGPGTPLPPKPKYPRLDSQLNRLVEQLGWRSAKSVAQDAPLHKEESVAVTLRVSGGVQTVVAFLQEKGATVANTGPDYIEAYVPVTLLTALEGRPEVLFVEAIVRPRPAVTSQGAAVHRSPIWNTGGFTGAGVKAGIIDGGFIGFSSLMGVELPATVVVRCYTAVGIFTSNLSDCQTETDHGTAVAEALVDMAPNASLYIANPFTKADLKAAASWMASQGVKIINHSVGWIWDGPGDGTSPFTNSALGAVDVAVAGGAIWANAAGNEAQSTWYGSFSDPDGDNFHNFSGSDETNNVILSAGQTITVQLRWEDSWTNASKDLDLLLYDSALNLVAFSTRNQSGGLGQTPFEQLLFVAPSAGTYHIAIARFAGGIPAWVQLQELRSKPLQYAVAERSIGNPAESANPGMLAVGAAKWSTPETIEPFSSQGPTNDGRVKPDIVGADRGDSVTYGPGGFQGTSQASPHVAGLAALVLERFPAFTPAQIADYLRGNALPRGAVPNNTWGYGLAQLPSLPPGPPTNVVAVAGDGQATLSWTAPSFDGGSPITQYTLTSNPGGVVKTAGGTTLSAAVTGLTNGTTYTFTITATNAVGTSIQSTSSNAVTPQPPPTPVPAVGGPGLLALAVLLVLLFGWGLLRRGAWGPARG